jgi:hypothetical protein
MVIYKVFEKEKTTKGFQLVTSNQYSNHRLFTLQKKLFYDFTEFKILGTKLKTQFFF